MGNALHFLADDLFFFFFFFSLSMIYIFIFDNFNFLMDDLHILVDDLHLLVDDFNFLLDDLHLSFHHTYVHNWPLQSFSQDHWPSFSRHLCCVR